MAILQTAQKWRTWHLCFHRLAVLLLFLSQISSNRTSSPLSCWTHDIPSKLSQYHPRWQSSWGRHGAHLGPVGPMLAPWTLLSGIPIYGLAQFVARSSGKKMTGMVWVQHILGFLMDVNSLQPSLFHCQWVVWNADTYLCSFETIQSIKSGVKVDRA